jgi:hypothetical protein
MINGAVPAQHRGGVLSALYLFAYLSQGAVALVLGVVATQRGLGFAVNLGAGVIGLLSTATIALLATLGDATSEVDLSINQTQRSRS